MKTRKLRDLEVSAIGMGCMGFSTAYGEIPSEEESIRLIHEAHDLGCTLFDTAEIYATFRNETLVGKALKPFRKEIVLSTKYSPSALMGQENIPDGKLSRAEVRTALEASMKGFRLIISTYISLIEFLRMLIRQNLPTGSEN